MSWKTSWKNTASPKSICLSCPRSSAKRPASYPHSRQPASWISEPLPHPRYSNSRGGGASLPRHSRLWRWRELRHAPGELGLVGDIHQSHVAVCWRRAAANGDWRHSTVDARNNTLNCGPLEYLPHDEFDRRLAAAVDGEIIVYATGDLTTALRLNPDQRKGLGDLMHAVRRASA